MACMNLALGTLAILSATLGVTMIGAQAASPSPSAPEIPADRCTGLSTLGLSAMDLGTSRIVLADIVRGDVVKTLSLSAAQAENFKDLPAFCRVAVHSSYSADSSVNSEVWLPLAGWNGRMIGTGNGGFAGQIVYGALADGLRRGFAVANTDMGTATAAGQPFSAMGHPIKWLDYGKRSTHGMTVAAKAVIASFYGTAAKYSYFQGCSTGGFQGLRNAQLFPEDYDGIIAGHAGNKRANKLMGILHNYMKPKLHPEGRLSDAKLTLMHKAVLAQCAGLAGGLKDDPFLAAPTACTWKPEVLLCKGGDDPDCLTQPQVDMANSYYAPFILGRTGQTVWPGEPRGTELAWKEYMDDADQRDPPYADALRSILGAAHDFTKSDLDRDVETYLQVQGPLWGDGDNADLSTFKNRGGKLLAYFGWNDPSTGFDMTNYINAVESDVMRRGKLSADKAATETRSFLRMFMLPGVEHCGGGNGPNTFDAVTSLMKWVEEGVAPVSIEATWKARPNRLQASLGRPMSRPLCAYPEVAQYKGRGDKAKAENFVCGKSK